MVNTQNEYNVDEYDYLLAHMGQIKINFKYGDEDLDERHLSGGNFGLAQALQSLHRIDFIESLEISQIEGIVNIDIDIKGIDRIDWSKTEISNYLPLQMLKDLEYYSKMSRKFDIILSDLNYVSYEKRDKVQDAGRHALQLIEGFKTSRFFTDWGTKKAIGDISHTMNKEVKYLMNHVRHRDSKRKKEEAINDATRHLISDISSFKRMNLDRIAIKEIIKL